MKSFKKLTLFTALFAFILSFGFSNATAQVKQKKEEMQPKTYVVKGKVVNAQTTNILTEAKVAIVGQDIETLTNAEGKFMLENLPEGNHTLKVTLEGYQDWEKEVTLDKNMELTIKLKPSPKQ